MANSGAYYQETATAITGAAMTPTASIAMSSSAALSAFTGISTMPTGDDKWILNQTNSVITAVTATTMGIEGGI